MNIISTNNSTLTNNNELFCPAINETPREYGISFHNHIDEQSTTDEQINSLITMLSDVYRTSLWYGPCSSGDISACVSYVATKVNRDTMLALAQGPSHDVSYKLHKMASETFSEIKNMITLYQCRQSWTRCAAATSFNIFWDHLKP